MALSRRNSVTASLILPRHLSSSFTTTSSSSIATPSSSIATPSSSAATSSSSSTDFEALLPTKPIPSYTSLKDLLPFTATLNSPTATTTSSGSEIPIRNRLVKQAAWAYLQPMSTSPNSGSNNLFRRVGARVLSIPLFSLIQAAAKAIAKAFCFCFR